MNVRAIAIASACVALNLALGKIAAVLTLPVYLDTIGTILGAALLPVGYATAVGVLSPLVAGFVIHPAAPFYVVTGIVIASLARFAAKRGLLSRWWTAALAGVGIGIAAAIVSAPVTTVVFGGVTLSGTTAINAVLIASGRRVWESVIAGSLLVEAVDKPIAAILAWAVLKRLPERLYRSPQQ